MQRFVETLLGCSETAANIARACRSEVALFHLLVEEKVGESRQKLTTTDFKTVADVLVQVAIKRCLVQEVMRTGSYSWLDVAAACVLVGLF